ncbi:MAG: SGNH/GDSL hydrolase family protein [Clostridia bacterium]|nr:SGNH/GDSL hydrolase family protein [Clostridia bacterium]MBQ5837414.1 SGNH/GDSL hydrolase family protein [Clostridia bacterium]
MKKIKIYGDSILKGVMYNEELKRYKLFGYRFDELAENGIEVENNCKMGATVDEGFEIMKATLEDCDEDTVVLLEYGGNDCNYNWSAVAEDPKGEYFPNTPEDKFTETYLKLVEYARNKGAKVAICTLVPIDSERFINWVTRGLNYENVIKWMGDINRIARWQEYYSRLSEKVAHIANCAILDLRSIFKGSMGNMLGIDGMHPSAEGHTVIREALQKKILAATV